MRRRIGTDKFISSNILSFILFKSSLRSKVSFRLIIINIRIYSSPLAISLIWSIYIISLLVSWLIYLLSWIFLQRSVHGCNHYIHHQWILKLFWINQRLIKLEFIISLISIFRRQSLYWFIFYSFKSLRSPTPLILMMIINRSFITLSLVSYNSTFFFNIIYKPRYSTSTNFPNIFTFSISSYRNLEWMIWSRLKSYFLTN